MSYLPQPKSQRHSTNSVEPWYQVILAWVAAMFLLAVFIWIFTGGRFLPELHSAAAAGPLVAFLPDSIFYMGGSSLAFYVVSLFAAFLIFRLPKSGVWLIVWVLSGAGFYVFRVAVAMTIV
jgi:hypothetical protein